jgi:superfamily II DNA or RNA helicase
MVTLQLSNLRTKVVWDQEPSAEVVKALGEATTYETTDYVRDWRFRNNPRFIAKKVVTPHALYRHDYRSFPSGVFNRVADALDGCGEEWNWADMRIRPEPGPLSHVLEGGREYQEQFLSLGMDNGRGIVDLATGGGKTRIAGAIISALDIPTLFLVHTKDLLQQTHAVFSELMPHQTIGMVGAGKVKPERITVAMVQTLGHKASAAWALPLMKETQCVFFDECHHLGSTTWYRLAGKMPNAYYRFGLSGTAFRTDGRGMLLEAATGPVLMSVGASTLIDGGFLSRPHILLVQCDWTPRIAEFAEAYDTHIVVNPVRNWLIACAALQGVKRNQPTLIIVKRIEHGEILYNLLEPHLWERLAFVHGGETPKVRDRVRQDFREGRLSVVIATSIYQEGVDVPAIGRYINAAAGKSDTATIQRLGRALRPAEGKDAVDVVDFLDEDRDEGSGRLGVLGRHSSQRRRAYRREHNFIVETILQEEWLTALTEDGCVPEEAVLENAEE